MIFLRLVKMEFDPEKVDDFLTFFETIKDELRSQEGCREVKLLRDLNHPNIVFSHSIWEEGQYLERYLKSDFFRGVWSETKKHFNAKPMAWSVETLEN